ncbi:YunG family protein [Methyloterricola oryzae]|uniref:YunG family protein n=1 Tax=Methyloterricola oryzae TaxID=1495050 RepID=UPI0005EB5914
MDERTFQIIRRALEKSWSADTSVCFSPTAAPSYGQCAQTAIVVQEYLGGEILRTTGWHGRGNHFYNSVAGERVDFTADQFDMPGYSYALKYEDCPSSVTEALAECLPGQVDALRHAFRRSIAGAA